MKILQQGESGSTCIGKATQEIQFSFGEVLLFPKLIAEEETKRIIFYPEKKGNIPTFISLELSFLIYADKKFTVYFYDGVVPFGAEAFKIPRLKKSLIEEEWKFTNIEELEKLICELEKSE